MSKSVASTVRSVINSQLSSQPADSGSMKLLIARRFPTLSSAPNRLFEAVQTCSRLNHPGGELGGSSLMDEAQPASQFHLTIEFRQRTSRHRYVIGELTGACSIGSLGDVRGDRHRSSAHLRDQPEAFWPREPAGQHICHSGQFDRVAPDPEPWEVLHFTPLPSTARPWKSIVEPRTENRQHLPRDRARPKAAA